MVFIALATFVGGVEGVGLGVPLEGSASGWVFLVIAGSPVLTVEEFILTAAVLYRSAPELEVVVTLAVLTGRLGSLGGSELVPTGAPGDVDFWLGDPKLFPVRADRGFENVVNFGTGTAESSI